MNVAVFGLGRSGLAVAEAVVELGGTVTVYDEKNERDISKPELIAEARALGAEVVLGFPFPDQPQSDFVVVNPAIDQRSPILKSLTSNRVEIISEVEFAFRISKAPILAITGTNGKSTTSVMTYLALKAGGIDAVLCGNIFGSGYPEMPLTTAALHSTDDQILVAEISSFQLEWIKDFKPWIGCITTITEDHLDRYDSFEQYAQIKCLLQRSDCLLASELVAPWLDANESSLIFFGEDNIGTQAIRILGSEIPIEDVRIIGRHNHSNIVAAGIMSTLAIERFARDHGNSQAAKWFREAQAAVSMTHEVSRNTIEVNRNTDEVIVISKESLKVPSKVLDALSSFPGLNHRMEMVANKGGVRFINNSMCTNPAAVRASIESLSEHVFVLMGGVNKDLDFRPIADFLNSTQYSVFLFGQDAKQINEQLGGIHSICSTMKEAFDAATKSAKDGDLVILAPGCASMDQFRDFRHRGDVFRDYVKEWTNE